MLHTRAQLLARRLNPADPARPVVDQLLDDSRVLGEIVDEMLESAALAGDPRRGEPLSAADLVQESAASMQVLASEAGVSLAVQTPGELPNPRFTDRTAARPDRTGGQRAVAHAGRRARRHRYRGSGDRVLITVTDDGEGLSGRRRRAADRTVRPRAGVGDPGRGRAAFRPRSVVGSRGRDGPRRDVYAGSASRVPASARRSTCRPPPTSTGVHRRSPFCVTGRQGCDGSGRGTGGEYPQLPMGAGAGRAGQPQLGPAAATRSRRIVQAEMSQRRVRHRT